MYSSMSYCCVEISPTLAQLQCDTVITQSGHTGGAFTSILGDAATAGPWQEAAIAAAARGNSSSSSSSGGRGIQGQHCFVLMMEVLDNLPHDR